MIRSMTAFASRTGADPSASWTWELRGVNGRGLDLRLRLPDGIEGLEATARAALGQAFSRGNITLGLKLQKTDSAEALQVDDDQLDRVLALIGKVQARAGDLGVSLAQPTAADVLGQRGVLVAGPVADRSEELRAALLSDLEHLIADFADMRAKEGAALLAIITGQLDRIQDLTAAAASAAEDRRPAAREALTAALRRVVEDVKDIDEGRIAQELAVLAVKADVSEEIDRLHAHVAAARALLGDPAPAGRKLDFLAQEFNREANTLCSKSGSTALTAIGLDLKATIDQMREQIQNVE